MNINEILEAVAEQNGTTVKEVRHEMELAIYSAKDNPNFKAIFGDRIPSVEEFILYCSAALHTTQSYAN